MPMAIPSLKATDAYPIQPEQAYFHTGFGEYMLPYEAVRTAPDREAAVLSFFQSTYEGGGSRWQTGTATPWKKAPSSCLGFQTGKPTAVNPV